MQAKLQNLRQKASGLLQSAMPRPLTFSERTALEAVDTWLRKEGNLDRYTTGRVVLRTDAANGDAPYWEVETRLGKDVKVFIVDQRLAVRMVAPYAASSFAYDR